MMTPLLPEAIAARKRPRMVLFVFFAELAWAFLVATPVHAFVRRAWGAHPEGDAVLWGAGGRDLIMWLGRDDAGLSVSIRTTMVLIAVGAVVMQLPLAALLASLPFEARTSTSTSMTADVDAEGEAATELKPRALTVGEALRVGLGAFLPLAALLVLGSLAAIVVISLGVMASSAVAHGFAESLGDARSHTLRLVVLALFGVLAAVIGVFVDLARAAIGRNVGLEATLGTSSSAWTRMIRGIKAALKTSKRGLGRATLAWAWRAALGVVLVGIGYFAATALGGRAGMALVFLWIVHQGVVLGRVALRASWLARAMRAVIPAKD
jgi:hypothetical protein